MHIRELVVHNMLDIITKCLQYTSITTAESWGKREEDSHSVALGRNQKKFKRGHEKKRRE